MLPDLRRQVFAEGLVLLAAHQLPVLGPLEVRVEDPLGRIQSLRRDTDLAEFGGQRGGAPLGLGCFVGTNPSRLGLVKIFAECGSSSTKTF